MVMFRCGVSIVGTDGKGSRRLTTSKKLGTSLLRGERGSGLLNHPFRSVPEGRDPSARDGRPPQPFVGPGGRRCWSFLHVLTIRGGGRTRWHQPPPREWRRFTTDEPRGFRGWAWDCGPHKTPLRVPHDTQKRNTSLLGSSFLF